MDVLELLESYHKDRNYRGLLSKINKNPKLKEDVLVLLQKFNFDVTLSEGIYLFLNNLDNKPFCIVCGGMVSFKNPNIGYFKSCSPKCSQNSESITIVRRKNSIKKYGVDHYTKTEKYKEILKEKIKRKEFGFSSEGFQKYLKDNKIDNVSQLQEIKNKKKLTFDNKSAEEKKLITEKQRLTVMTKYGVSNSYELAKRFLYKDFTTPSGKIIKLQGYEDVGYKKLLEIYAEEEIVFHRKEVPNILYEINGAFKKYYPDFWVPKDNLIIEIKSKWTLSVKKDINYKKMAAASNHGFVSQIWVCSKHCIEDVIYF